MEKNYQLNQTVKEVLKYTDLKQMRQEIANPDWEKRAGTLEYSWQDYIPKEFKEIWFSRFDHTARVAMYVMAVRQAEKDESDAFEAMAEASSETTRRL